MKLTSFARAAVLGGLILVSISLPAFSANIAFVSFHADPTDLPSSNAAAFGFAEAPDVGYTDLLRSAGHTVTRVLTADNSTAASLSSLNSYDVVIIGRSVNSGHYQTDTETAAWNGLTVPVISIGGFPLRGGATNTRLGFFTGDQLPDTTGPIKLTVNDPSHPIFAGIALDGSNTMVNDYTTIATLPHAPNTAQRGTSINTSPLVPGGTVLATVPLMTGSPPVAVTGKPIAFIPRGTPLATGTGPVDVLGGPRLVFLTGSREAADQMFPGQPSATNSETAGIYDLSADGGRMFLNAVAFMAAIPEPSSMTMLLLAIAGLALTRKR